VLNKKKKRRGLVPRHERRETHRGMTRTGACRDPSKVDGREVWRRKKLQDTRNKKRGSGCEVITIFNQDKKRGEEKLGKRAKERRVGRFSATDAKVEYSMMAGKQGGRGGN